MKKEEMVKTDAKLADLDLDLHGLNKGVVSSQPEMSKAELGQMYSKIKRWAKAQKAEYLALFSHENRDFTVFRLSPNSTTDDFISSLKEVVASRGTPKEYYINPRSGGAELWIDNSFYALFKYDEGVVVVG